MIGIYKITNQITGKCYIGQSINIECRWKEHISNSKKNRKNNKFYSAMRKYGVENFVFEVIEECSPNQQELDERECFWIKHYNSFNDGYNSSPGGQLNGSWRYSPDEIRHLWDEGYSFKEIMNKIGCSKGTVRKRLAGYSDYNLSTSHIRGAIKAYKESKLLSKQSVNSYVIHQYSIDGEYIASYESLNEAVRKLGKGEGSESNIIRALKTKNQKLAFGYQWSYEKVERMPIVLYRAAKLVRCIETNQIFHSTVEAAYWAGLKSKSGVREYCAGIIKTAGKHPITGEKLHWEYVT